MQVSEKQIRDAIDKLTSTDLQSKTILSDALIEKLSQMRSKYAKKFYQTFPKSYYIDDPKTADQKTWNRYAGIFQSLDQLKDQHQIYRVYDFEDYYHLRRNEVSQWYYHTIKPQIRDLIQIVTQDHLELDAFCQGEIKRTTHHYELNYFRPNFDLYYRNSDVSKAALGRRFHLTSGQTTSYLSQKRLPNLKILFQIIDNSNLNLNDLLTDPKPYSRR